MDTKVDSNVILILLNGTVCFYYHIHVGNEETDSSMSPVGLHVTLDKKFHILSATSASGCRKVRDREKREIFHVSCFLSCTRGQLSEKFSCRKSREGFSRLLCNNELTMGD